VNNEKKFQV